MGGAMRNPSKRGLLAIVLGLSAIVAVSVAASSAGARSAAGIQVPVSGTGAPQTGFFVPSGSGDVTAAEFAGEGGDNGSAPSFTGTIVDRSLSTGNGEGVSTTSGKKAKSNPQFVTGFEGLNFFQQRYARGGDQFAL